MSDMWKLIHRHWNSVKSPGRPHPQLVETIEREVGTAGKHVLLLGVTPEFARFGETLTAVDLNPEMIGALWIGDDANRKAIVGNWLDLPVDSGTVDLVVGDLCLNQLAKGSDRRKMLQEIARVLKPDGQGALRVTLPPDPPETLAAIKADTLLGEMDGMTELQTRLLIALADESDDRISVVGDMVEAFDTLFPDRAELKTATGWDDETIGYLTMIRGSKAQFSFVPESRTLEEAREWFGAVRLAPTGTYRMAECYALMILGSPRPEG